MIANSLMTKYFKTIILSAAKGQFPSKLISDQKEMLLVILL